MRVNDLDDVFVSDDYALHCLVELVHRIDEPAAKPENTDPDDTPHPRLNLAYARILNRDLSAAVLQRLDDPVYLLGVHGGRLGSVHLREQRAVWYVWGNMEPEYSEFSAWDDFKYVLGGLFLIALPIGLLWLLASLFL